MHNRPEDRPLVIVLSLAIIGVFGYFIWQRVRAANDAGPEVAPAIARTASPVGQPAQPQPGQMRILDDSVLDGDHVPGVDPTAHADAFAPLSRPATVAAARRQGVVPVPYIHLPAMELAPPPQKRAAAPSAPTLIATLDGVVDSDTAGAEAMLTLRDDGGTGADGAERTITLHLGDRIGGHALVRVTAEGIQLRDTNWWPIGDARPWLRSQLTVQLVPPVRGSRAAAAPAHATETSADAGSPERAEAEVTARQAPTTNRFPGDH